MSAPTVGLVERVRSRLAAAGGDTGPADVLAALRTLRQEFTGAGPLDELLRDPRTTDVLVCGSAAVWVDRGLGLERTAVRFPTTRRCAGWRNGSPSPRVAGSMTRALTST